MSSSVKVGGSFREAAPYVKVGSNWKFAPEAWSKVSGVWKQWFLAGGTNDSTFAVADIKNGLNGSISAIAIQSDGKILLGGIFTTFNGVNTNRIIRLNSDGTLDTAFATNTGAGANAVVNAFTLQSDGKILVGGSHSSFNGNTSAKYITRLNSDGTLDTAFATNTGAGTGLNGAVFATAIQTDGKILIGGTFTTFNTTSVTRIARLNSDGTLDTAFTTNTGTGAQGTLFAIALQSDGKILVGGAHANFNGTTAARYITRLNSNGTPDTAFTTNTGSGVNNSVYGIKVQADGKIFVGGLFSNFNGNTSAKYLAKLNSDGTLDTTFTTNTAAGLNGGVYTIAIQSDGKIVVGGFFTLINVSTAVRIARFNADGTADTAFATNISTGANGNVNAIALQSDGKILVGGAFLLFRGLPAPYITRLLTSGIQDTTFIADDNTAANGVIYTIALQSDGKILVGGDFTHFGSTLVNRIMRLNIDGTLDTSFTTLMGSGANFAVNKIYIQSDGKILVGGAFTTFNSATRSRLLRFNADYSLDTTFNTNIGTAWNTGYVNDFDVQSNGAIVLVNNTQNSATWNAVTATANDNIVRLNSDGTLDAAFTGAVGTASFYLVVRYGILKVAVQSDGKILVGLTFNRWNGASISSYIIRLNSDGSRDTAFNTAGGTGTNNIVNGIVVQPDGKIIVGGNFSTFNGVATGRLTRLNSNGSLDTTFATNGGTGLSGQVNAIRLQADGKILAGGSFTTFNGVTVNRIARLNSDGTLDTAFTTNTGTGANSTVNEIAINSNKKIFIGGLFTAFNSIVRSRIATLGGDLTS